MRMPQESGSSNAGVGDAVRRWFGRRRPRRLKPAIRDAAGDAGRDAMRPAAVLGRPSPGGVGLRPDGHRADHDADIRVSSRFRTSGEFEYECLRPTRKVCTFCVGTSSQLGQRHPRAVMCRCRSDRTGITELVGI
jgi:hypothetical protein